jgi:LacI family transcriptional regulator
MSPFKKPKIKDIARETNLSITTISRVLNGKAKEYRISQKTQDRVMEAAQKLNYSANNMAASLRSGKSRTIAVLVPKLSNPFFAGLASEIHSYLQKEGFTMILSESGESLDVEKKILKNLLTYNIEGLIIVPAKADFDHILKMKKYDLPIVCMDRYFEDLDLPYVSTDNYQGACQATQLLIDNGHTRILAIQGITQSVPNQQRVRGFMDVMKKAGIEKINIVGNSFSIQNGYLETKMALQGIEKPTAIFAFSNTIALGCLKALREEHMEVPDDISLICFDDHPYLDFLASPLSCVEQPVSDIAQLAIRFLFSIINDKSSKAQQILLKPKLKFRNSIKKITG